jgi:hypothetical protein
LVLDSCSVYEAALLDDAAAGVDISGSSSGGSKGGPVIVPGEGGAGKHGGADDGGANSGAKPGNGGTGTPPDETGGAAGEEAGGTTGSAGSEPSAGTAGNTGGSGGSGSNLLDGFEDNDLTVELSDGRSGVWYLFDDGTVGEEGPAPFVCSKLVSAPAQLGLLAMHVTATGFTGWGSGLGVDFRAGKKPYDASQLSGVRFWARVGEGKNTRHRVQLADSTTDKLGGKCNPALTAPDGEKCEDHFGKNLILTTSWTEYVVPFADLSQIGWGQPAAALDKSTLYGLQVTAKAKLDVDLWLDQIEFF